MEAHNVVTEHRHHGEILPEDVVYSLVVPRKSEAYEAIRDDIKQIQESTDKLQQDVKDLQSRWNSQPWTQKHPDLKWLLTTVLALVAIVVACLFGVEPMLEKYAGTLIKDRVYEGMREQGAKTDQISRDVAQLGRDVGEIKGQLMFLAPLVRDQAQKRIKESALLPKDKFQQDLPQLSAALTLAKSAQVTAVDSGTLKQVGNRLIEATANERSGDAWTAFNSLLSYRSFLNAKADPNYESAVFTGSKPPPSLPKHGPGLMPSYHNTFAHMSVQLDGVSWNEDTFIDATIFYDGGPVELHNVKFQNCVFIIRASQPSRELGKEILASNVVSFRNVG